MRVFRVLAASGLALAVATPAFADITIIDGQVPGNLSTVQLTGGVLDTNVTGTINPDNTVVRITSLENIVAPAKGQARVEASDGALGSLTIGLLDPTLGFTRAEFNINADRDGPVSIVAYDQFGTAFGTGFGGIGTYSVDASGENFFNFTTSNDQFITRIVLSSSTAIGDVRQIRLDGVGEFEAGGGGASVGVVPEPATWAMMILGFGGAGAMLRRRRLVPAS